MGDWEDDFTTVDPKTGESSGGPNDHEAREQRLRNIEAVKRIRAGDYEGADALLSGKNPP